MDENLTVERKGAVAVVTLNRPELRNAFDDVLIANLNRTLQALEKDETVRAVVLAGAGKAFCAGADLNWMKRMAGYSYEQNLADAQALAGMLRTLDRLSKPTIARVHGPAYAGGVGLVAACDIAVGSHAAEFCLTEVKLGLSPATISPYVVRAVGERLARRYFLTAEVIGAAEAHRLHLLSALTTADDLDAAIDGILRHLLAGGREAQARIKDLVGSVSAGAIDDTMIADTARRIAEIRVSAEGKEGIAAFLEKRPPGWARKD